MTKRTTIIIIGLWIALIPSLGLPGDWKNWIIVISGLVVSAVAFKKKRIYLEVDEDSEEYKKQIQKDTY
jgi:hypothetical protein